MYIFFGRDQQISDLLGRLGPGRPTRFLAVIGASGCGKSSLVRAGLIDALETGLLASAGSRWRIATMQPRDQPLAQLARTLVRDGVLGSNRPDDLVEIASLQATLARGPLGLLEALRDAGATRDENILLLVDQFEEVFRFRREVDRDEADAFVALLLRTASEPNCRVFVVLTMRSDFLGDCALFTGLPEALNDNQFLTPKLSREQRREAIEGPAMVFEGQVEEALVNAILNDMGTALDDQLPLMQHSLMRLWINATQTAGEGGEIVLKLDDYRAIGTITGALDRDAEHAYMELLTDDSQRAIAEALFRRLTDRDAGGRSALRRDTRRTASLADVARVVGRLSPDETLPGELVERVKAVIEVLRAEDLNFLTPPAPEPLNPETVLDVSHESLIRQWKRLGGEKSAAKEGWIDKEAKSAEMYRRLSLAQAEWAERQRQTGRGVDDTHVDREGLLNRLTLENALEWRKSQDPSPAWASRYGGDLAAVLTFVQLNDRVRREQDEAEKHRLELEKRQAEELAEARQHQLEAARELSEMRQASLNRSESLLKRVKIFLAVSVSLGFLVAVLAGIAIQNRNQAIQTQKQLYESKAKEALLDFKQKNEAIRSASTLLRYQALDAMAQHPQRGLLLAAELRRLSDDSEKKGFGRIAENDDALRPALANIGGRPLQGHVGNITALKTDLQGRWIATGGDDGTIRLWKPGSESPSVHPIVLSSSSSSSPPPISNIVFDAQGRWLVSQDNAGVVKLWDLRRPSPSKPLTLRDKSRSVVGLNLSKRGHWLLIMNEVQTEALLYDLNLPDPSTTPIRLKVGLSQIGTRPFSFSLDETKLAICRFESSAESDPKIAWRFRFLVRASRDLWAFLLGEGRFPRHSHLSPEDPIASVTQWDLSSSETIAEPHTVTLPESNGPLKNIEFLKDNQTLSIFDGHATLQRYDFSKPQPKIREFKLREPESPWKTVGFTRDAQWVVTTDESKGKARLWNAWADDPLANPIDLKGFNSGIDQWVYVVPGRWLIARSTAEPAMRLWNLHASRIVAPPLILRGSRLAHHRDRIQTFVVTNDRWLITGSTSSASISTRPPRPTSEVPGASLKTVSDVLPSPYGGEDNDAHAWNLEAPDPSVTPVPLHGHEGAVNFLALTGDNRRLVTAGRDPIARLWELVPINPVVEPVVVRGNGPGEQLRIPGGSRLARAGIDGSVSLTDLADPNARFTPLKVDDNRFRVGSLKSDRDGRWLIVTMADNAGQRATTVAWDMTSPDPGASKPLVLLADHAHPTPRNDILDNSLSEPSGRWLASSGVFENNLENNLVVGLWRITRSPAMAVRKIDLPKTRRDSLGLLKAGRLLDLVSPSEYSSLPLSLPIGKVALARAASKWFVWLRDYLTNFTPRPQAGVLALSQNARWLLTYDDDSINLWDLGCGEQTDRVFSCPIQAKSMILNQPVLLSPDGRWLVIGDRNPGSPGLRVWRLPPAGRAAKGSLLPVTEDRDFFAKSTQFSADGHWLFHASRSMEGGTQLWDMGGEQPAGPVRLPGPLTKSPERTPQQQVSPPVWNNRQFFYVFSPDGRWLINGWADGTTRLWNLGSKDPAASGLVLKSSGTVTSAIFDSTGRWLATLSGEEARLWDLLADDPSARSEAVRNHGGSPTALAVAVGAGGRWVALASGLDKAARLWDLTSSEPEARSRPVRLSGHEAVINTIFIQREGRRVVTIGVDGTARFWTIDPKELERRAAGAAGRNLTRAEWSTFFPDSPYDCTFPDLPCPLDGATDQPR